MPLMPLDIPAGVYKNGTDLQAMGRWHDASLVRWMDNTMQPMGGWRVRSASGSFAPVRGMISWTDNTGSRYYSGGTYNNLYIGTALMLGSRLSTRQRLQLASQTRKLTLDMAAICTAGSPTAMHEVMRTLGE